MFKQIATASMGANKQIRACEQGAISGLLIGLVVVIFALSMLAFFVFGQIVPPNSIGLRQNYFSLPGVLKEGFEDRGLDPGLHWKVPGLSTVHLIPRDFQFIQFNVGSAEGDYDRPALEVPTTDGSKVKTDLTLITRYFDHVRKGDDAARPKEEVAEDGVPIMLANIGSHGGPRQLVNAFTFTPERQRDTFSRKVEEYLLRSLSKLSTTDFYNPVLRERAALAANTEINRAVNPDGIELWSTLIRRYVYSQKNIDDQIFAKNLQEQTERLNAAKSALAEAQAKTEQTRAIWDAKVQVLTEEGAAKVRVVNAEASRFEQEKIAEGDKLLEIALAEVERAKNNAFASPGGEVYLAREMIPVVTGIQGGVLTDIDPFDINSWLKRLIPGR